MKKFIALLLSLMIFAVCLPLTVSAAPASGDGTEESPYLISTKKELNWVRNDLTAHYKLANDIVFTEADFETGGAFYNGGVGFKPIEDFEGTFDGNGHIISGIRISCPSNKYTRVGLFAMITGATIVNLTIKNPEIFVRDKDSTTSNCGAIAGTAVGSVIDNCKIVSGYLINDSGAEGHGTLAAQYGAVGGVIGLAIDCSITNCTNSARIYRWNPKDNFYGDAGGIVGISACVTRSNEMTIENCTNSGKVINKTYGETGGIAGYAYSQAGSVVIRNCRNSGAIEANGAGGIVGLVMGVDSLVSNCSFSGSIKRIATNGFTGGIAGGSIYSSDGNNTRIINNKNEGGRFTADDKENIGQIIGYKGNAKVSGNTYTPATVTGFSASPLSYNSTQLKWKQVLCCSGYKILRATSKDREYKEIADVRGAANTKYTDTGLKLGRKYYYKIFAYYQKGSQNNAGKTKTIAEVTVSTAAPTVSVKKISSGKITVSWKKVTKASGYQIYRSTSKTGTYKKIKTIGSGSTISYTNSGLSKGKKYYYKVRSYSKVNGKTVYSPFSSIKYATA